MEKTEIKKKKKDHRWVAIIAGGQGTRLFPLSHVDCPKQFCQLRPGVTFIQDTVDRFTECGVKTTNIVVITTNEMQTKLARAQLAQRNVLSVNVHEIRPDYDYAGAMVKAAEFIYELDPEAIIMNTPADQYIAVDDNFKTTIVRAFESAADGYPTVVGVKISDIVTFTGCGHAIYEHGDNDGNQTVFDITGFVEKPDKKKATEMMRADISACNTGINCWSARKILEATACYRDRALRTDQLMELLGNEKKLSIGTFVWHDCGTLKSLYQVSEKTPNHKNATIGGKVVDRNDCRGSLFIVPDGVSLYATGVKDTAIVINLVGERFVFAAVKLDQSQHVRALAENFDAHKAIFENDFSLDARNNIVMPTNLSQEVMFGFIGTNGFIVSVVKDYDGHVVFNVGVIDDKNGKK